MFRRVENNASFGVYLRISLIFILLTLIGGGAFYIYQTAPIFYGGAATGRPIIWTRLPTPVVQQPGWETFSSTRSVREVLQTGPLTWVGSDGGLVVYDNRGESVSFHPEHGLPGNRVHAVATGVDGRIWVGSPNSGIAVYDGATWERFSAENGLVSNQINDLLIDSENRVWAATERGLMRYDGQRWRLVRFSLVDLNPPPVRGLLYSQNTLWAASSDGLFSFDGEGWERYGLEEGVINPNILSLAAAPDGRIWAGTPSGISIFDGASWDRFTVRDGLIDAPIRHLASYRGGIVVGYGGDDAEKVDLILNRTVTPLRRNDPFVVQNLTADGTDLWLSTDAGLWTLTPGDLLDAVPLPEAIPSTRLTEIAESDEAVWVTGDRGLSRYRDGAWASRELGDVRAISATPSGTLALAFETPSKGIVLLDDIDGVAEEVVCRTAGVNVGYLYNGTVGPDGEIWFLGDLAINRYVDGRWTTHTTGLPEPYVPRKILFDTAGHLWLGLGEGLFLYGAENDRWEQVDPTPIYRMAADPNGALWLATEDGIVRLESGIREPVPSPPLAGLTRGFVANRFGLWISSESGIGRYDGERWSVYGPDEGLPSNLVTTLATDTAGNVWAGFGAERTGFATYEADRDRWRVVPNIVISDHPTNGHPPDSRMVDNRVMSLGITSQESIWFGTYTGDVGRVTEDELRYRPEDYKLYWRSIRSILVPPDDSVWLAGWEGRLARFVTAENRWEIYERDLSTAEVRALVVTEDKAWFGSSAGVVALDRDGSGACGLIQSQEELNVISGQFDPITENVWWATDNSGGYLLNRESERLETPVLSLRGRNFVDTVRGPDDAIWFVTNQELITVLGERKSRLPFPEEFPNVTAVGIGPDFRPWVGTDEGLYFQRGQAWESLATDDGLAGEVIIDIFTASDGAIWVLSDGGISRFAP